MTNSNVFICINSTFSKKLCAILCINFYVIMYLQIYHLSMGVTACSHCQWLRPRLIKNGLYSNVWNSTHYTETETVANSDRCHWVLYPISLSWSRFCQCEQAIRHKLTNSFQGCLRINSKGLWKSVQVDSWSSVSAPRRYGS